jgi:hypothetical protein
LIGAPFRDEGGEIDSGAAYLFDPIVEFLSSETWKFVPHDHNSAHEFGAAVALGGTHAVVGAPGSTALSQGNYFGEVYVFDQNYGGSGNWTQAMTRIPLDGKAVDLFGYAVAVDGDTILVGAPLHDGPQADSGAAYFYPYDINDSPADIVIMPFWVLENLPIGTVVGELVASDPDFEDFHIFTLVSGTGSDDNASFSITGSMVHTNEVFDFETRSTYQIRVRATDLNGATFEKALLVDILDSDEEDADNDGLTQAQETNLGTSDTKPDSDGDGFGDGLEYNCMGSDPANPNSGPFHLTIDVTPPTAIFTWHSQVGVTYILEQRPDLTTGTWAEISSSQVTATGLFTMAEIALNPPNASRMFYRLRVLCPM